MAEVFTTLRFTNALVLLVLSAGLLWRCRRDEPGRAWLGILMSINLILVAGGVIISRGWMSAGQTPIVFSIYFATFAASPLLLSLSIRRLAFPAPVQISDLIALVPAFLLAGVLILLCLFWSPGETPFSHRETWLALLITLHGIAVFAFVQAYRTARDASSWVRLLLAVFVGHWFFSAASGFTSILQLPGTLVLETLSHAGLLAFALVAAGTGIRFLSMQFPGVPQVHRPTPGIDELGRRLKHLFENERIYLDPDLTLELLATRARASERDVSHVLNSILGGGYHEVVRRHRIQEAQQLLRDRPEATVLEILHEAGFNSKSAFHRAFSEYVGMTPREYRQQMVDMRR